MEIDHIHNITGYIARLNRRLRGTCYVIDYSCVEYYAQVMSGKARFRLWTGTPPSIRDFCIWEISSDKKDSERLELLMQEIVEDKTNWLQRLLGLENELAIDALPGK